MTPDGELHDDDIVTVVVPARDEAAFIARCLDSVLAQDYDNLQVLVVDGDSLDATSDIVRSYTARDPRVELLHNPQGIIPVSLNLALAAARGRWLVRIDAHATIPERYVSTAVRHLRTGRWGGVGGRKDGVGVTPAGSAVAAAMASPFGVGNSAYHYATTRRVVDHIPFGAYPVALARKLGGWDERLVVNQDFEFDYRLRQAGFELLLDPEMTIDWYCRQSIPDLFRQYRRYGRGKAAVIKLHPASMRLRHLAAPALVASWVAGLALLSSRHRRLAAVPVAPYLALLVGATAHSKHDLADPRGLRYLPVASVAMHAGWGLGFWRGVVEAPSRKPLHRRYAAPTAEAPLEPGHSHTDVPQSVWCAQL